MSDLREEKLYETDWVSLRRLNWPSQGINGYDFLHEERCNGKIVAILPFRQTDSGSKEFLLRKELTPCWDIIEQQISSITGGFEKDYGIYGTALKELEEEAGYKVFRRELIKLGTCRGTKSSDTTYHLFTVDLTNVERGEATGDGSELEDKASCLWMDSIHESVDPLVYTMYVRIKERI